MNRGAKGLLWFCAILLLLFLGAETAASYLSFCQVQQLQQELAQLRINMEQLNSCLDENLDDIAALCAAVNETQQRIQELLGEDHPLSRLLPG